MMGSSLKAILEEPSIRGRARALPKNGLVTSFMKTLILNEHSSKEPFYVLDLGVVANLMDTWTNNLPAVRPYYAVKCNPDPALLAALAALGSGFDCASRAEIESVLALGVTPDRIVFANPCKMEPDIEYAAGVGVNLTTFDSESEVEKIREFHPECSLLIRIKPPVDGAARWPLDSKFGALPEEVEPLLGAAQAARLPVVGVALHVGCGATNMRAYTAAIGAAKRVFDLAAGLGMAPMRVLDVGGGFTPGALFEEAASAIRAGIREYFTDATELSVVGEPGRYLSEPAFTLAAKIIGKRVRAEEREYFINDGVYGSMMMSAVLEHGNLTCVGMACDCEGEGRGLATYSSTVFGPTCDAIDTVLRGHRLPELKVNDWLVFPNMGAYSSALRSGFNGFNPRPFTTYLAYSNHVL